MKRILRGADDDVAAWVMAQTGGGWSPGRGTAIGLTNGHRLIAGVVFEAWNGASLMMHVASDGSREWMNREFLRLSFAYPFLQLGAKKVLAPVAPSNLRCQDFLARLGFFSEVSIPDAHPEGDLQIWTMTPAQCRWHLLEPRNGR